MAAFGDTVSYQFQGTYHVTTVPAVVNKVNDDGTLNLVVLGPAGATIQTVSGVSHVNNATEGTDPGQWAER